MRLSRQSEIAIGILAICAERPTERIRTQAVADLTDTTKDHAAQIVALLVRRGFLATLRGRQGGLELKMAPADIILGNVLRVTQPELAFFAIPGVFPSQREILFSEQSSKQHSLRFSR
jgi:Rrf2 family transcriptional regulator, nitric oxide-sensitive transcriptional repressor